MHFTRYAIAFVLWVGAACAVVHADQGPPVINVTPFAESESARPGTTVRLALKITVPPGIHIQSDHPRDPSLIPAVLSIDAPSGVIFSDVAFPKSTEFRVAGFDDLLDVFEGEIVVGARLTIEKTRGPACSSCRPGSVTRLQREHVLRSDKSRYELDAADWRWRQYAKESRRVCVGRLDARAAHYRNSGSAANLHTGARTGRGEHRVDRRRAGPVHCFTIAGTGDT